MAAYYTGRRPALIPSTDTLSGDEVQDVFGNRIVRPTIPPPNACPAVLDSQTRTGNGNGKAEKLQPCEQPESQEKMSHLEYLGQLNCNRESHSQDEELGYSAPHCTSQQGDHNRSVKADGPGKEEYARGRAPRQEVTNLSRESKRKHAVYSRDDTRRYSPEILEDTPHMSEVDSERGFRSPCKDVFGVKGQKSVFVEVCASMVE